jgi:hypothetical protein
MAEKDYKIASTTIAGIELRVLKGFDPKIPTAVIRSFMRKAKPYAGADFKIAKEKELQEKLKPEMIEYAQAMPGLRGIRSVPENWDLLLIEKTKEPTYNRILLRESLGGTLYPELVSEEIIVTVIAPQGKVTAEDFRQNLHHLFEKAGIPPKEIQKLFKIESRLNVDSEKLNQLVAEGRIALQPGTITEQAPTWAIKVDLVRKPQKETRVKDTDKIA